MKGYNENDLTNFINGIKPYKFSYNWDAYTMNKIGEEFNYYICNAEYSTGWNGELFHTIPLSLPQVIMDWSTVTTIGAGILDTIGYYTNYSLLSWSSPIGLPNIIWQNVKQSSESLSLQGVLAVLGLRED